MNSGDRWFGCRLRAFVQIYGVGDAWRLWETHFLPGIFFFFFSFIFGHVGSLLLHGLFSSCGELVLLSSCGVQASHCSGFSLWSMGSRCPDFSSCGSQALEHRLGSCGTQASLL